MSKKAFKSQASSSRAVSGALGAGSTAFGGGAGTFAFGGVASSPLSYVYEPPNLTNLSDPNVGVAFKNLQKRDGITKAKALEDLQLYVLSLEAEKRGLEDAMLEAWVKLYPRTSIDGSRRVRQLAHTLQGQISISCGKRMGRHMTTVVASWVSGQYDNDKLVNRAATDSFQLVFATEVKRKNVWRLYQASLAEYSRHVVVKESANTLSDERTTSPDDASAKYSSVVGAAITTLTNLIEIVPIAEYEKTQSISSDLLHDEKLWRLAYHSDSFVRRAVYKLLDKVLVTQEVFLDLSMISASVLVSCLNIDQSGSAYDYIVAISNLSISHPEVWTRYYRGSGKKSALTRLCQFLSRGSQGGPEDYWIHVKTLISHVPSDVLLPTLNERAEEDLDKEPPSPSPVLAALREGLRNRNETRSNQATIWRVYLDVATLVQSALQSFQDRQRFIKASVLPLVVQFVKPLPERTAWTVSSPNAQDLVVYACRLIFRTDPKIFEQEWRVLSTQIIEDLQTSLPEQSKEFTKSQDFLSAEVGKWYALQAAIVKSYEAMRPILLETVPSEILSAINTLKARNGKPYGAAAALEYSVESVPELVFEREDIKATIVEFMVKDVPDLILSPSAKYFVNILDALDGTISIHSGYRACLNALAQAPESAVKSIALQSFISSPCLASTASLFEVVMSSLRQALRSDEASYWEIVMAAVSNPHAPTELTDEIFAQMIEGLSVDAENSTSLRGLEKTMQQDKGKLRNFALSPSGSALISRLLLLTDSPDESISQRAKKLNVRVESVLAVDGVTGQATNSMMEIVNRGLETAGEYSLSVEALVSQAQKILENCSPTHAAALGDGLLPNLLQWRTALDPFISRSPDASQAITNTLGGALSLIAATSSSPSETDIARDVNGYSSAFRIAQYTSKLIKSTGVFDHASRERKGITCKYIAQVIQLASDDIGVPGSMPLWEYSDPGLENEMVDFVADIQSLLLSWLRNMDRTLSDFVSDAQSQLLNESRGLTATSYYSGRAYCMMTMEVVELHGAKASIDPIGQIKALRTSPDVFTAAAYLTSTSESQELLRLCNHLLTDLTGHDFSENMNEGMRKLVLLNSIFSRAEDYFGEIPQQRLVFFVQHIVQQMLGKASSSSMVGGQIMAILYFVLPRLSEIYGPFWAQILDEVQTIGPQAKLYALHSGLRLLSLLGKLHVQEANDDLVDAWVERKGALANYLVNLLRQRADFPDASHQPGMITNELLHRKLLGMSETVKVQVQDLYPVLTSESSALQSTVYELLHQKIPSDQEQVSLTKALSPEYLAQLPEELFSLVLAAPSKKSPAEQSFERNIPSSLRTYLLSWLLIFDHWENASYKVQADYVAALKEGRYAHEFLEFALYFLISARSKPVDASKFDIERTMLGGEETPEKETQWALIRIYYLCLRHLPSITKEWWRDSASRQLSIAVEAWTQKHISPAIITKELSIISDWASSQATADQPMNIKVSQSAREITASIPIDEQTMTIAIRLPPSYPLARAEVESVHRVAVAEKKWRFWIINAQGVINFSSGGAGEGNSIIDGLMAWRNNVTAAMKGQTECAICYSVVSADRQLPSKKCSTCKNTFHSSCLFKWFKSSNSSSCPLCRNAFNYS